MSREIIEQPKDKAKDDILKRNNCVFQQEQFLGSKGAENLSNEEVVGDVSNVYAAMDQWAKIQGMQFESFIHGDISKICYRNNDGTWNITRPSKIPQPDEILTDDQMWNLFLQHQSQQIKG